MRITTSDIVMVSNPAKRPASRFACFIGGMAVAMSFTAAAHAQSTGVPVCDDFLKKYTTCVTSKLPANLQATYKSQLEQTQKAWVDMAKNPAMKASMEATCKQSMDAMKAALQAYGCSF
jgi:hypothetical protein